MTIGTSTQQSPDEVTAAPAADPSSDPNPPPPAPLLIHDRIQVKWRDGQQNLPAVIIERRPSKKRKRMEIVDIDCLPADGVEYYVHYIDHDRYVELQEGGYFF
jgi:hypothetical protein